MSLDKIEARSRLAVTAAADGVRRRGKRSMATVLSLALTVPTLLFIPTAQAGENGGLGRPKLPDSRADKVREVTGLGAKKARDQVSRDKKANREQAARALREQRRAAWPKQGSATVRLTGNVKAAATGTLGGLPLTVRPATGKDGLPGATDVRFTVLGADAAEAAGVNGVLFTGTADTAGRARVTVGYQGLAGAMGGGWASRLRLVELPSCALTTPEKPACRKQTPLPSANDTTALNVTASLALPEDGGLAPQLTTAGSSTAGVYALSAAGAGEGEAPNGSGDYSATPLAPSASWEAGGSSGSFTWKHDLTPPARRRRCHWRTTPAASTGAAPRRTTRARRWARGSPSPSPTSSAPTATATRTATTASTTSAGSTTTPGWSSTARRRCWSRTARPVSGGSRTTTPPR
ncbi:hypothetical protein GCM10010478_33730 [Streptomyces erythrogriseus]|uniref:Uncharacterized protein n=1 Tax=Streptomyces erythrogriseus TaxID=284027 RepID=A0ABN3WWE3_9ACTN